MLLGVLSLILTVSQQVVAFVVVLGLSGLILFVLTRRGLDRPLTRFGPDGHHVGRYFPIVKYSPRQDSAAGTFGARLALGPPTWLVPDGAR